MIMAMSRSHADHGPASQSAAPVGDIIMPTAGRPPYLFAIAARVEDSAEGLRVWQRLDGKDVVSVQVTRADGHEQHRANRGGG